MSLIKIGVVGAGTMGSGISQVAATAEHSVVLVDSFPNALIKGKDSIVKSLNKQVEKGIINKETYDAILSRIEFSEDTNSLQGCGLIIEAIIEDLSVKQNLFSQVEKLVSDDCILATNTSSLSVVSIASACVKPERVIGIHFFNPAQLMPLVELIPALTTDENILIQTKNIIDSWGKKTVIAKDTPGFIVNRIARPFY